MKLFLEHKYKRKATILGRYRPPIHPLTLSFDSENLRREFAEYSTLRSLPYVRLSMALAITLYIAFAWLDPYVIPHYVSEILILRVVGCVFFSVAIFLTYTQWILRNFQLLMLLVILLGGIDIIAMILISESAGGYFYYAGLMLAIMYAHGLLRMRFINATTSSWAIIFIYLGLTVSLGTTPFYIFMNNLFFLVAANIMGMFASYWLEYYMKAAFWQTRRLQIKSKQLELEHERKSRELEAARNLQLNLLPNSSPRLTDYEFSFSMNTATEIGGDFYDYLIDENETLTFAIGDATGHGAQAGVIVTAVKILFADHAGELDIVDFLNRASKAINQMGYRKLYMAFAIGRIRGDIMEIAGAGIPPALIYRADGGFIEELPLKGLPLGSSAMYPYNRTSISLNPGDTILFMTDGLPELFNRQREMFGYERTQRLFSSLVALQPNQIIEQLNAEVVNWLNGHTQEDDTTFFLIKRKPLQKKLASIPAIAAQVSN